MRLGIGSATCKAGCEGGDAGGVDFGAPTVRLEGDEGAVLGGPLVDVPGRRIVTEGRRTPRRRLRRRFRRGRRREGRRDGGRGRVGRADAAGGGTVPEEADGARAGLVADDGEDKDVRVGARDVDELVGEGGRAPDRVGRSVEVGAGDEAPVAAVDAGDDQGPVVGDVVGVGGPVRAGVAGVLMLLTSGTWTSQTGLLPACCGNWSRRSFQSRSRLRP